MSLAETGGPKLFKEGTAFLGAGNSGEPARLAERSAFHHRLLRDQLSGVDTASGAHDPSQLVEDLSARRIQIEDAVYQRDVDRAVLKWEPLRIRSGERDRDAEGCRPLTSSRQHRFAEIDPDHSPTCSDATGRDQAVDAGTTSEIKHRRPSADLGEDRNVGDSCKGLDGDGGQRAKKIGRVSQTSRENPSDRKRVLILRPRRGGGEGGSNGIPEPLRLPGREFKATYHRTLLYYYSH
jgi:hypothetical protein